MFNISQVQVVAKKGLVRKPRTLEDDVRAAGLAVIPLDRVRKYQAHMVAQWNAMSTIATAFYSSWEHTHDFQFAPLNPPSDVTRAIQIAQTIKDATVYAERFETDPFYFVARRGTNKKAQIVCFAYHDAVGFEP